MHLLSLLAVLLCLLGCTPSPAVSPDGPTIAPGMSTIPNWWKWPQQGPASGDLDAIVKDMTSPQDVAAYLLRTTEWRDDYDTGVFLKPADVVDAHRSVCSGFARFWQYALARQGIRADFVAFWGPSSAHAVAVFRAPDGRYRLGSNQYFYSNLDLDPGNRGREAALLAAAQEFYGDQWSHLLVFSDSGQVTQEIKNTKATEVPMAAPSGRGLFSVRR